MQFIDSHFHADIMDRAEGGIAGVLERMRSANVRAISIGTHKDDWPIIAELAGKHPELLNYTVGLHPSEVKENWKEHITALEKILSNRPTATPTPNPALGAGNINMGASAPKPPSATLGPCGVGEIGLDYFRLKEDPPSPTHATTARQAPIADIVKWQKEAFAAQLSIVKSIGLPCVIHSRGEGAYKDIVKMIDQAQADWTKFVFHCFGEGPTEIRELNARGCRGSFTGIITFKNGQKAREALIAQGPSMLMVETDAPFLSPEPHRGQVNDPSRVPLIAAKAAELLQIPLETLAAQLIKNTVEFFGLKAWA